ncbi:nuclear transport factor 2 family protein [Nocardioides sp.]|uniref:nuclear transport factor 2 family protein n=1 Tax=Nocardioides sp. TaxID=35761 RepID=UPI003D0FA66B
MTTTADLPLAIETYLAASLTRDAPAAAAVLSPEVRVLDDGGTYVGHAAVMEWFERAASEFTYTTTLLEATRITDGTWVVTNRLDGNFPGNTVTLDYTFQLGADGRIVDLVIAP